MKKLSILFLDSMSESLLDNFKDIEQIKNASKKIFPIKFSDVHPFTKSHSITKEKINLMESFWIKSGFKVSKRKLLGLIN